MKSVKNKVKAHLMASVWQIEDQIKLQVQNQVRYMVVDRSWGPVQFQIRGQVRLQVELLVEYEVDPIWI